MPIRIQKILNNGFVVEEVAGSLVVGPGVEVYQNEDGLPQMDIGPFGTVKVAVLPEGKVSFTFSGNPVTRSFSYKFVVAPVGQGAFPDDPIGASVINAPRGEVVIDDVILEHDEEMYITGWFWAAENASGTMSPPVQALATVPPNSKIAPSVKSEPSQSGSTGILTLTITDPDKVVTAIQYATKSGAGDFGAFTDTDWNASAGTPGTDETLVRTKTVQLSSSHNSAIKYRVVYVLDGVTMEEVGSHTFDLDTQAEITGIEIGFSESGTIVVSAIGDEDTDKIYVRAAEGIVPADPTDQSNHGVINGRNGSVDTGVECDPDEIAYVKVRGATPNGDLGPVMLAELRRPKITSVQIPSVKADPTQSSGVGTLSLTIRDPDKIVTAVEFATKTGSGNFSFFTSGGWASSSGTIGVDDVLQRTVNVPLQSTHNSAVKWRVVYVVDGVQHENVGSHTFDLDNTPEITGVTIGFSATGTIVVSVVGDEDVSNIYITAGQNFVPSDPTSSNYDATITGRTGVVDTGVVCAENATASVKVRGRNSSGSLGAVVRADMRRPATGGTRAPSVKADPTQSGGTGTLALTITDPDRVVTAIQYQVKSGAGDFGGSWLSTWDSSSGTPGLHTPLTRSKNVTLSGLHNSAIKYRILYTIAGTQFEIVGAHTFDIDDTPEINGFEIGFDASNKVTINVVGDEDCANIYVTVGVGSTPSDPTAVSNHGSLSGRNGTITTTVTCNPGQTAYVKIRPRNSSGSYGMVVSGNKLNPSSGGSGGSAQVTHVLAEKLDDGTSCLNRAQIRVGYECVLSPGYLVYVDEFRGGVYSRNIINGSSSPSNVSILVYLIGFNQPGDFMPTQFQYRVQVKNGGTVVATAWSNTVMFNNFVSCPE